jgi:hypothetical protein
MSFLSCYCRARSAAFILSFVLINLFPGATTAVAGQGAASAAGIIGQITDGTGAILPGVTVTATSPALQVPSVTTVTDAQGEYRLSPLPIGIYAVVYELAGFQNLRRENVRLTVGFVAKLDQVLNLGAVSETITVSGASPLVDVTNTSTRTELTREQLDVLPTSRDGLKAFMGQVPGIRSNLDVGSSSLTDGVVYRAYGQLGESWNMLEGVLASSPDVNSGGGSHVEFNSIEGTRVQTIGSNAEMPRRGILVDAILKSGGNDFHGMGNVYGSSGRLEANNVSDELRAAGVRGAQKLHSLTDFSGNLGGRIIRNKVWFFVGARREGYNREALDAFYDDGSPILLNTWMPYHLEKVSYQATPGNRFTGFYHVATDNQRRSASKFVPAESRELAHGPVTLTKGEWQHVRGNSLVVSAQSGYYHYNYDYHSMETGSRISTTDIGTLYQTGDVLTDGRHRQYKRYHSKGAVSWYKSDFLGGNHDFKGGIDYVDSWVSDAYAARAAGDYQLQFNNGVPFQIATRNTPVEPNNKSVYAGLYFQDNWTLARRLTLSLGARYSYDNAFAPEQCREAGAFAVARCFDRVQMAKFNEVVPRLHAAFDLLGDGKTVLKGGWGRFVHFREIITEVQPVAANNLESTTWVWHDQNGNRNYDAGEVNLNPNGPDFVSLTGATSGAGAIVNPNEKPPKSDQFDVTLEHELPGNWAVRVTGIYATNFDEYRVAEVDRPASAYNIPVTNLDPGPDGRLGTADDTGKSFTYYEFPASLNGRAFTRTTLVNDPAADQTYKTIEVAGSRRLAGGWQFSASYSATKFHVPFTCDFSTGAVNFVVRGCPATPNAEINTATNTWERSGKISGAYILPYGITASANYDHRSGNPESRRVLFTGGRTIRSFLMNVDPLGTIRLPATNLVDLRMAKRFSLGGGRSVEARADIFNLMNTNTVLRRVLQSGSTYLLPFVSGANATTAIVLPRILQVGATFAF